GVPGIRLGQKTGGSRDRRSTANGLSRTAPGYIVEHDIGASALSPARLRRDPAVQHDTPAGHTVLFARSVGVTLRFRCAAVRPIGCIGDFARAEDRLTDTHDGRTFLDSEFV